MSFYDHTPADDELVAYGFLAEADEQTQLMQNKYIQLFRSAGDARKALACATSEVQVVVCDRPSELLAYDLDVSPLNLAAALHRDNPQRDIYIEKLEPERLFISRAEATGARDVIAPEDAERLLGVTAKAAPPSLNATAPLAKVTVFPSTATTTLPSPTRAGRATPSYDLNWLEQVLELEDLDEYSSTSSASVLAKQPVFEPKPVSRYDSAPEQLLLGHQEPLGNGVVAAFVSGRGGVGKSSLTILAAMDLWKAGSKVAVLDLDLQFGDLGILAGNEPESNIRRLSMEQLCENQIKIPALEDALLLLEAPEHPEAAEELVHWIPRLLAALKGVADIVLINTSCLWTEAAAVLASSVDKLVICMDQRATSISAARQVVELCIRLQIPSTQLFFLLNRTARNAPITDIDASLAMGGVDIITIAEGGADVDELLSLGCPLELLIAQSALRQSIHDLGSLLLAHPSAGVATGGGYR